MSNLVLLRDTSLRDIPGMLRRLADSIESGKHGEVTGCAMVLESDGCEAFYWGEGETAKAHILFSIGMRKVQEAYE